MRRNLLSGSISSWLNSPQQVSNRKSSKYATAFVNLPKQVLGDILDTVNACNKSDQPFDDLKIFLLEQFGKSKWLF
jgi:hypothetical protein